MITEIIVISLIVAIILAVVFWKRKGAQEVSDYVEPSYHPSGKQWVFNGILDIENPPADSLCLVDYPERIQLMTRKGFMLFEMQVNQDTLSLDDVGLYEVRILHRDASVAVAHKDKIIGYLNNTPTWLSHKLNENTIVRAYAFIASRKTKEGKDSFYGDVCIGVMA
jgi:hypothetical protein